MALDAFSRNAKPLPLPLPPTPPPPSPPTQTIINKQVVGSSRESSSRVYRGRLIAYYSLFTAFVYGFFFFSASVFFVVNDNDWDKKETNMQEKEKYWFSE